MAIKKIGRKLIPKRQILSNMETIFSVNKTTSSAIDKRKKQNGVRKWPSDNILELAISEKFMSEF